MNLKLLGCEIEIETTCFVPLRKPCICSYSVLLSVTSSGSAYVGSVWVVSQIFSGPSSGDRILWKVVMKKGLISGPSRWSKCFGRPVVVAPISVIATQY
jgi:hypothetical protein